MSELMNNTLDVSRPAPRHFSFSEPFWQATRDRKVLLQYCRVTRSLPVLSQAGQRLHRRAGSRVARSVGRGEIFSFTVARIGRPPFAGHTPYLIATVTLDEGVNVIANVIGCALDRIAIGMRVRAAWAPLPDGTNLLLFEPDEPAGAKA